MSKKINGNKLIIALSDWWYSSFGLEETEESKAIQKVLDAVERYVDHEKSADNWIPCSERLPDAGAILISDGNQVFIGAYHGNNTWSADGCDYDPMLENIAWMPLPKPYKGGDTE